MKGTINSANYTDGEGLQRC